MTDHEITQLALKAGKGDKVAMDRVIAISTERVWQQIHAHCGNMKLEDQEDLSQELLLQIVKSIHNFKGKSEYKTWLWPLIHNRINDTYRKYFRRNTRIQWVEIDEWELGKKDRYKVPDTSFMVWEVLKYIPEWHRRPLELHYKQGYSISEIQEIEGTTYEATRSRLRRARAYLAERPELWQ